MKEKLPPVLETLAISIYYDLSIKIKIIIIVIIIICERNTSTGKPSKWSFPFSYLYSSFASSSSRFLCSGNSSSKGRHVWSSWRKWCTWGLIHLRYGKDRTGPLSALTSILSSNQDEINPPSSLQISIWCTSLVRFASQTVNVSSEFCSKSFLKNLSRMCISDCSPDSPWKIIWTVASVPASWTSAVFTVMSIRFWLISRFSVEIFDLQSPKLNASIFFNLFFCLLFSVTVHNFLVNWQVWFRKHCFE